MVKELKLTTEEAEKALAEAQEAADAYNKLHNFTRMVVYPLANGNVQIVVERVPEMHT